MKGVVKMTANELLEILKDHYKDDKTLIKETNDLLEQIYKGKKFIYQFEKGLEEYCLDKHLCPLCGGNIISDEYYTYVGEYQGTPAYETVKVVGCEESNCPYVV